LLVHATPEVHISGQPLRYGPCQRSSLPPGNQLYILSPEIPTSLFSIIRPSNIHLFPFSHNSSPSPYYCPSPAMPYRYRSSGFGPSGSEEHSGFTTQQLKAHQEQLQRAGYEQARRRKPSQQSQCIGEDRSQVSRGRRSTRTDSESGVPGQSGHPAGG
jgi:hypothetical protein